VLEPNVINIVKAQCASGMSESFQMLGFEFVFFPFFIFIVIAIIIYIMFTWFSRSVKSMDEAAMSEASGNQPVLREKEIIRKIVKIRCPYCKNLYDENLDKCPNCGAGHP